MSWHKEQLLIFWVLLGDLSTASRFDAGRQEEIDVQAGNVSESAAFNVMLRNGDHSRPDLGECVWWKGEQDRSSLC